MLRIGATISVPRFVKQPKGRDDCRSFPTISLHHGHRGCTSTSSGRAELLSFVDPGRLQNIGGTTSLQIRPKQSLRHHSVPSSRRATFFVDFPTLDLSFDAAEGVSRLTHPHVIGQTRRRYSRQAQSLIDRLSRYQVRASFECRTLIFKLPCAALVEIFSVRPGRLVYPRDVIEMVRVSVNGRLEIHIRIRKSNDKDRECPRLLETLDHQRC